MPSPAWITPLLINRFPNKLAPNVDNNIPRNLPFSSFAYFLIILLTLLMEIFMNGHFKSEWTKIPLCFFLTIFIVSVKLSFENAIVVVPYPKTFSWISTSVADTAAVNPNGIKTLLSNGLSTFFIKDKPVFSETKFSSSD